MSRFGFFLLMASALPVCAEVKLPEFFSDHMVLQREMPVPIWGTAAPGEKVDVAFAGQSVTATADANGKWIAKLAPLKASEAPAELTVKAANTVTLKDVVVGDVWLASGQSNMDSPMSSGSAATFLPAANDPLFRFFKVTKSISAAPEGDCKGDWQLLTPESAKPLSAVAYFFAAQVRATQKVPVGVIHSAWGGTPIRTWMPLVAFEQAPPLQSLLTEWKTASEKHEALKGKPEVMEAYYKDMKDWETNVDGPFREAKKRYDADVAAAKAAGQPTPPKPQPSRPEPVVPDPISMPSASKRPSTPTITYNAMIAPLAGYALKGAIWYQGEADASHGLEYRDLLPRLITGWRTAWAQGDFPFLIVQLPGNLKDTEPVASQGIAWLREAQAMALKVPATGMAVTADIGDVAEVHPDNKYFVGQRLSLVARELVYGEKIVGVGPLYKSSEIKGSEVHIRFDHTGGGLAIGSAPWVAKSGTPIPTDRLVGFYICGADKKWVEAEAKIEGDAVIVSAASVAAPAAVRYAWANTPRANLYNKEGLPAGPFRTDDWPR